MVNSKGRSERNVGVSLEEANAPVAIEVAESDSKQQTAIIGGGVEDVYGEDGCTGDHFITHWSVSVVRCKRRNMLISYKPSERARSYKSGTSHYAEPPKLPGENLTAKPAKKQPYFREYSSNCYSRQRKLMWKGKDAFHFSNIKLVEPYDMRD